jgi:hypothetical protein
VSLGVTPAEVRDGFVALYFGPVQVLLLDPPAGLGGMDRLRARRVIDSANFATNYGALDPWLADIRALGSVRILQDAVSDDTFPPAANDQLLFLAIPIARRVGAQPRRRVRRRVRLASPPLRPDQTADAPGRGSISTASSNWVRTPIPIVCARPARTGSTIRSTRA